MTRPWLSSPPHAAAASEPSSTPVAALTIYPRVGDPRPSDVTPRGPGLLLMGGGATVDPAFVWMHDVITGKHGVRGGDVVVLTAAYGDVYTGYLMKVAPFNSVRSIMVGPQATRADLAKAASYVDEAQGLFFTGGDQADYVKWKGSPLIAAVQHLYDRGGVVGGTSAGLAILGEYVFDSVADDAQSDADVQTPDALANPAESTISFTHALLDFPPLRRTITDSHLVVRNRVGRTMVFLARLQALTPEPILGIGINAGSAIVIDPHGIGTLMLEHHQGEALLLRLTQKTPIVAGKPFEAHGIRVTLLDRDGQRVNFTTWCASAPTFLVNVDGAKPPYYSPNPYVAPPDATIPSCR